MRTDGQQIYDEADSHILQLFVTNALKIIQWPLHVAGLGKLEPDVTYLGEVGSDV
jgi:hypothetical protein